MLDKSLVTASQRTGLEPVEAGGRTASSARRHSAALAEVAVRDLMRRFMEGKRPGSLRVLGPLLLLLFSTALFAADPSATFDQANKLYEQGKFADAAKAYSGLLESGHASAALHFNLGNALFKSGELGQAIVQYRLARRLAPRDPEIAANLRFARETAKSGKDAQPGWIAWSRLASLNELSWLAALLLWAWIGLRVAVLLFPARRAAFRSGSLWLGTAVLLAFAWLAALWREEVGSRPAVLITREAAVRLGPLEESQSAFTLRDGAELRVRDSKDGWLQIEAPGGRLGWIRQGQAVLLNAAKKISPPQN